MWTWIGYQDSRAQVMAYLRATVDNHLRTEVIEAFLDNGPAMVHFLREVAGLELIARPLSPDYKPERGGRHAGRPLHGPSHLRRSGTGGDVLDAAANLAAPFALSRAAIGAIGAIGTMRGRGGAIVNIASIFGLIGAASSAAYAPTKAAIIGMTQQLATEYGRDGIRVNAVAPGLIATPLTAERLASNAWFRRMMLEGTPLGRPGQAEEVARACRFLASNDAAFVTGAVLPVDGGWSNAKFLPYPTEVA